MDERDYMIFGVIIDLAVGALLIILGVLLWKKQKITLLHDYHYKHVKKEDIPAYTGQMGMGLMIIGAGICITGLLSLVNSPFWWVSLAAGFVPGIILMYRAQKKYNGSVLS